MWDYSWVIGELDWATSHQGRLTTRCLLGCHFSAGSHCWLCDCPYCAGHCLLLNNAFLYLTWLLNEIRHERYMALTHLSVLILQSQHFGLQGFLLYVYVFDFLSTRYSYHNPFTFPFKCYLNHSPVWEMSPQAMLYRGRGSAAESPCFADCPTSHYISQSLHFHFFCSHALAIALINYISLVALETEVRECITWVQRKRERKRKKSWEEARKKERQKAGGGLERGDGESGCWGISRVSD